MSCNSRLSASGIASIGWSEAGIDKYNELYWNINYDRRINGAVFNQALLSVHLERQRIAKAKPNHAVALRKQRTTSSIPPVLVSPVKFLCEPIKTLESK